MNREGFNALQAVVEGFEYSASPQPAEGEDIKHVDVTSDGHEIDVAGVMNAISLAREDADSVLPHFLIVASHKTRITLADQSIDLKYA